MAKNPFLYIDESLKEKPKADEKTDVPGDEEKEQPEVKPPAPSLKEEATTGAGVIVLLIIYFTIFPYFIGKVFPAVQNENWRDLLTALFCFPIFAAGYYMLFTSLPKGKKGIAILLISVVMTILALSNLVCENRQSDQAKKIEALKQEQVEPGSKPNTPEMFVSPPYPLDKGKVVSTVSFPDRSTVYFEATKEFYLIERYGLKGDGSSKLTFVRMPAGRSKRYFTWGGTLRIKGIHDNTTVVMTY